jgi:hypothetical protein
MIHFAQIRKDCDIPHVNFKTFADTPPSILTIGVLTAKRRPDSG